jgi:NADH-quinone oxidoreductase subunit L
VSALPAADSSTLLWLIPAMPLFGFVITGLLSLVGSRSDNGPERKLVATFGILAPVLAFGFSLHAAFTQAAAGVPLQQTLWTWIAGAEFSTSIGFRFDQLTGLMLGFVTGIGSLICLYSAGYMAKDRGFARFFAYLNLFLFSMCVLVLADNMLLTFLGWEGVGLCSYLLVGFWHKDHENNDAARKAFVVNRVGDLAVLLGMFCLMGAMGDAASLNYADLAAWAQAQEHGSGLLTAATLLLFLGCTAKSAQIPLFTWLPDAMAGPTPVSALIHAATMVTAGIFLMARISDVMVLSPATLDVILIVAVATALYAAFVGLVQWDIKKILAYSTVSQLGFMFMAVGVGAFDVALFHVFTHAFFKATLFLGAGSVIHALHHEQDVRRMGGLAGRMPLTFISVFFAWYAIVGLPLGSGFWSKDLILERLFVAGGLGTVMWVLALVGAFLTAVYMTRFMTHVFWSPARPAHGDEHHIEPVPAAMGIPVAILGICSLVAGTFAWMLFPGSNHLERYLAPVLGPAQTRLAELAYHGADAHGGGSAAAVAGAAADHGHHISLPLLIALMVAGTGAAVLGIFIALKKFGKGPADATVKPLEGTEAGLTWAFDRVYQSLVVQPLVALARIVDTLVEKMLLGGFFKAFGEVVAFVGAGYQGFQRSRLRTSLAASLIGAVLLIAIVVIDLLERAS